MNLTTKQVETLAIALIVLTIVTNISSPLSQVMAARLFRNNEVMSMTLEAHAMRWAQALIYYLVNAGLGIWLFLTAKQAGRAKWIWALFALTYGLSAVILYFVLDLLEQLKRRNISDLAPEPRP